MQFLAKSREFSLFSLAHVRNFLAELKIQMLTDSTYLAIMRIDNKHPLRCKKLESLVRSSQRTVERNNGFLFEEEKKKTTLHFVLELVAFYSNLIQFSSKGFSFV